MGEGRQDNEPEIVDAIIEALQKAKRIGVASHIRPDGDSIGCTLALGLALEAQGKEVGLWNPDPVPKKYRFLDPEGRIQQAPKGVKIDLLVSVDAASQERLGSTWDRIQKPVFVINIDHHGSNPGFGDLNWVDARMPATGHLIYQLICRAGWEITPRIADSLLTAIATDTGSFQYATTLPESFEIAATLLRKGANLAQMAREVYHSNSLARVGLLRHLYTHFRLSPDQRIAWLWLRPQDFARTGADRSEAEELIDHLRAMEPVVVACVFEQLPEGKIRISLRSKDPRLDVSQIAIQFGGGGHAAAAGARIAGSPRSVQRKVLSAVQRALESTLGKKEEEENNG